MAGIGAGQGTDPPEEKEAMLQDLDGFLSKPEDQELFDYSQNRLTPPPGRRIRPAIQEQESPRRNFRSLLLQGLELNFCIMQRPRSAARRSFSLRCSSRICFLTAASLFLSASRSFFCCSSSFFSH